MLEADYANFRAALAWLTGNGDAASALRLAAALGGFWCVRMHLRDGQSWLRRALAMDDRTRPDLRVRALSALQVVTFTGGDYNEPGALRDEIVAVAAEAGDPESLATALLSSAFIHLGQNDAATSAELAIESLRRFEAAQMPVGACTALFHLARSRLYAGNADEARELLDESIQRGREHGDLYMTGLALHDRGELARAEGDDPLAASLFAEALQCFQDLGDLGKIAWSLELIAAVRGRVDPGQAARCLGAADALRTAIAWPIPAGELADHDRATGAIRDRMGHDAFEAAWSTGAEQPVEHFLAEMNALASTPGP